MKNVRNVSIVFALLLLLNADSQGQKRHKATVPVKPQPTRQGVLSIQAALIYRSGDVKPVVRTGFLLLDEEVISILQKAQLVEADREEAIYTALRLLTNSDRRTAEAIVPHVVASMNTDFDGRGKFPPVPAGTYYVFGTSEIGPAFWGVKVSLHAGENSLILENSNIAFRQ
jgi:hypothetical protein